MLELVRTKRTDPRLLEIMPRHYSAPKGFVGRNLCYAVLYDGVYYGHTVAGSATLHLPGRTEFFGPEFQINQVANNTFFHVEKQQGRYPVRCFVEKVVKAWELQVATDWPQTYQDPLQGFETLVELPRTGACYLAAGWTLVGQTKGYTCKRSGGQGTDSWTGRRVWDTKNLRPKLVFCKKAP